MNESMPRELRERYNKAFVYAVSAKDLRFETADDFADWFARVGWLFHGDDLAAGFALWLRDQHPGQVGGSDVSG